MHFTITTALLRPVIFIIITCMKQPLPSYIKPCHNSILWQQLHNDMHMRNVTLLCSIIASHGTWVRLLLLYRHMMEGVEDGLKYSGLRRCRVRKISLRFCEYTQGIKRWICFHYYIKTRSVWCFWFSTTVTMKSALLCTVIMLHHAACSQSVIATTASSDPIRGKSLFRVVICSFRVSSCDKKNLKRISIPYDVLWNSLCALYPIARGSGI